VIDRAIRAFNDAVQLVVGLLPLPHLGRLRPLELEKAAVRLVSLLVLPSALVVPFLLALLYRG
jgi:hypothetical protein